MHTFRVWAPVPGRVELVLGERRLAMTRAPLALAPGGGWWEATDEESGPGTDYAFSLDGGEPLPDPRSPLQPFGVHGPSRLVDHASSSLEHSGWTDAGWRGVPLAGAVLYELHVGTFSAEGTFDGAIAHLDHVASLGADAIELMPVAEFP